MNKLITASLVVGFVTLVGLLGMYATMFRAIGSLNEQPVAAAAKVIPLPDANDIEARVNVYRNENGLATLADSQVLSDAAQARAEQMCADNDWSHHKAWEILDPRYSYSYASENLYFDYLSEDLARLAIEGWVSSDGHRENMLKDHREIGVGVKSCPGFQGYDTAVIITNYFGVPQ